MKMPFAKKTVTEEPTPTPAPPADEVERLTAELEAARAVHAAAVASEEAARQRFFEAGDELSKRALRMARDATGDAFEDVGRMQHLLAIAEEKKAAATRAANERRCEELREELSLDAVVAAASPLAEQEADLLMQVATVRAKRLQLAVDLQAKAHALRGVMSTLGMHISAPMLVAQSHVFTIEGANIGLADGPDMVADLVERTLSTLPAADLRRGALEALKPSRTPTRV